MNKQSEHLAFTQGLGIGGIAGASISLLIACWALSSISNQKPTPTFNVVGKYKNCEIVRFVPTTGSAPQFVLNCSTK